MKFETIIDQGNIVSGTKDELKCFGCKSKEIKVFNLEYKRCYCRKCEETGKAYFWQRQEQSDCYPIHKIKVIKDVRQKSKEK